jgi:hypothetical protein
MLLTTSTKTEFLSVFGTTRLTTHHSLLVTFSMTRFQLAFCCFLLGAVTMFAISRLHMNQYFNQHFNQYFNQSDSLQRVAADAPHFTDSDQRKRNTIIAACRYVADQIDAKTITTRDDVFAALTIETANVSANPNWKPIMLRLEKIWKKENDLHQLGETLKNTAKRFCDLKIDNYTKHTLN